MLKHLLLCCVLMGFVTALKPLSILLVQPLASTSHHVWTMSLVKGLLSRGHHVHLVSIHEANIEDKLAQNLTSFVFDDMMSDLFKNDDYDATIWKQFSVYKMIHFQYDWGYELCERVTKTRAASELLKTVKNVEFDVIVQDITMNECMFGLWEVAKGKPPVVGFIPLGCALWFKDYVGGSNYPSIRPYGYSEVAVPVGLWQKTWNAFYYIMDDYIRHYRYLPAVQPIAERYMGHEIRPLHEIGKNISIVLLNTYPAYEYGIPLPPNAIEIGGLHAQVSQPVADESIRKFLDGATNGAVVISLGTNVAWKSFGTDKLKTVILALSKLKQRVLWKIKDTLSLPMPDNVMAVKWLPQGDVMTHKNVKVLWAHGGLLSTHEAIWHGIPIIAMPFFLDQKSNVALMVSKGIGVHLDFDTLTTQSILDAFDKIFYDESYTINMKRLSREFRDRPVPPLDLAVWSVEYAARHQPGSLVSPIRSQNWMQRNGIDICVFLFFILIIILLAMLFISKMLFNFYYHYTYPTYNLRKRKTE